MKVKILDIGCGNRKYKSPGDEVIGIDYVKLNGVDVVHDLEEGIPFPDNTFDMIVSNYSLGHIKNFFFIMSEIYRVGKPNAIVKIKAPFYSSERQWNNPTQVQFFSLRTFEIFEREHKRHYYKQVGNTSFKVKSAKLIFGTGRSKILNPIINPIVNRFQRLYSKFFVWTLPCQEIHYKLEVDK